MPAETEALMLKDFVKAQKPEDEEFITRLEEERAKLFAAQMKIKEAGLPVMVIFEGWGAAGKGSVLGKIIKNIGFAATANNLFVWTKYSGWDPDVNSFGSNIKKMGCDMGSYPSNRAYSFDVKFTF